MFGCFGTLAIFSELGGTSFIIQRRMHSIEGARVGFDCTLDARKIDLR